MMELSNRLQPETTRQHFNNAVQATDSDRERSATDAVNDLAVLTLDENGMIRECNQSGADLLGCGPSKVSCLHVSRFLPRLGGVALLQGERVNPYLRFLSRVGYQFELIGMGGAHFASHLFFNEAENQSSPGLRVIIQPIGPAAALS